MVGGGGFYFMRVLHIEAGLCGTFEPGGCSSSTCLQSGLHEMGFKILGLKNSTLQLWGVLSRI